MESTDRNAFMGFTGESRQLEVATQYLTVTHNTFTARGHIVCEIHFCATITKFISYSEIRVNSWHVKRF